MWLSACVHLFEETMMFASSTSRTAAYDESETQQVFNENEKQYKKAEQRRPRDAPYIGL